MVESSARPWTDITSGRPIFTSRWSITRPGSRAPTARWGKSSLLLSADTPCLSYGTGRGTSPGSFPSPARAAASCGAWSASEAGGMVTFVWVLGAPLLWRIWMRRFSAAGLLDYRAALSRKAGGTFALHVEVYREGDDRPTVPEVLQALNEVEAVRDGVARASLRTPTVCFSANGRWATTGVSKRKILLDEPA